MITTRQLMQWLERAGEMQEHYATLAARGDMPITKHAAAANYAAKCELLRSLIQESKRNDSLHWGSGGDEQRAVTG